MKTLIDLKNMILECLELGKMISATISGVKKSVACEMKNVAVRPVIIGGNEKVQLEYRRTDNKAVHENASFADAAERVIELMGGEFYQMMLYTVDGDYQIFSSKKAASDDSIRVVKKPPTKKRSVSEHDRKKNHILSDGNRYDFLVKLGISDESGKVYAKKYDKFRQLNRYLEFVRDVAGSFDKSKRLKVIDFGCGKAYLTFALHHYLVNELGYDVDIVGLDLKKDVIESLGKIAASMDCRGLRFELGDISGFDLENEADAPDMVISLHACDTATDASLIKAVGWGTKVIFAVPCCQHEINSLISEDNNLMPLLSHGLFKERFSSLLTDTLRGLALEALGYGVQMVEFIDMEHTPKNVLIKAVRRSSLADEEKRSEYEKLKREFGIESIFLDRIMK